MFRAAIITASDKGAKGQREDVSGSVIREILEQNGYEVVYQVILPDERQLLAEEMERICVQQQAGLVLTTGGTGFSPRDWTPEATLDVIERQVPGIPEAMQAKQFTDYQTGYAEPGCGRYSGKDIDYKLAGQSKGCS